MFYDDAIALIEDLFDMLQNRQAYQQRLVASGHSAFLPYQDWVNAVCEEHDILGKHEKAAIESAKAILHNSNLHLQSSGTLEVTRYRKDLDPAEHWYDPSDNPWDPFRLLNNTMESTKPEQYRLVEHSIAAAREAIIIQELKFVLEDPDFHAVNKRYHKYNRSHRNKFIHAYVITHPV